MEETQILRENSFRSIINLTTDISKFKNLQDFVFEIIKRAKILFKVDRAKILILDKNSAHFLEYTKEDNETKMIKHDFSGSLAKEVIENNATKAVINPATSSIYNQIIDLDTSLPILCLPIQNPLMNMHSEYHKNSASEKIPKNIVLGVLQIANPQAMAMEYNLILKNIDQDMMSQFLKYVSYSLVNILSL